LEKQDQLLTQLAAKISIKYQLAGLTMTTGNLENTPTLTIGLRLKPARGCLSCLSCLPAFVYIHRLISDCILLPLSSQV
jgi:hypothetical protein